MSEFLFTSIAQRKGCSTDRVGPCPNLHNTVHMKHALHGLARAVPVGVCAGKQRASAMFALLLLIFAMTTVAQASERLWTVTCGLPQQDNPVLDPFPTGGYTGPWPSDSPSGHMEVKTLNRPHPESGISTEMWMLSRDVGWWRLKVIRVHPDDLSKLSVESVEDMLHIRQIIDSPFLSRSVVIRGADSGEEELVNGQILALLPDASRLRCASQSER